MTKMMRFKHSMSAFCLLTMLICVGCATYVKVRPLAGGSFSPTSSCEVFTAAAPTRAFTELALIEVGQGGDTIGIAKKKAMAMGADAIIMRGSQAYGSVDLGGGLTGTANKTTFVAIKWKTTKD